MTLNPLPLRESRERGSLRCVEGRREDPVGVVVSVKEKEMNRVVTSREGELVETSGINV